jgi:hypothetical protein
MCLKCNDFAVSLCTNGRKALANMNHFHSKIIVLSVLRVLHLLGLYIPTVIFVDEFWLEFMLYKGRTVHYVKSVPFPCDGTGIEFSENKLKCHSSLWCNEDGKL